MRDVQVICPLPWRAEDDIIFPAHGHHVCFVQSHGDDESRTFEDDEAIAAEIVHRVNTYSDLYEALKQVRALLDNPKAPTVEESKSMANAVHAALKKAEERL